jgi:hypothetical protein
MGYSYVITKDRQPPKRKQEKCSGHFSNGKSCSRYATVWRAERGLAGVERGFCKLE